MLIRREGQSKLVSFGKLIRSLANIRTPQAPIVAEYYLLAESQHEWDLSKIIAIAFWNFRIFNIKLRDFVKQSKISTE